MTEATRESKKRGTRQCQSEYQQYKSRGKGGPNGSFHLRGERSGLDDDLTTNNEKAARAIDAG